MPISEETRKRKFLDRVMPEPNTGCWFWLGASGSHGYGNVSYQSKTTTAHRAAYLMFKGEIPDGKLVCHRCDEPSCVNPDHLWLGNHNDNMQDMVGKNRQKKGENCSWAILTKKDVENIRSLRARGLTLDKIGEIYGTCRANVSKICLFQSWKDTP